MAGGGGQRERTEKNFGKCRTGQLKERASFFLNYGLTHPQTEIVESWRLSGAGDAKDRCECFSS